MTLPRSWANNSRQLSQFVTPIIPLPGSKKIPLNELTDDQAPRHARLSTGVTSAATMQFATSYEAVSDSTLMPILTRSIVGGYYMGKKYVPMKHPLFPMLYAKDIVELTFLGVEDSGMEKIAPYSTAILTVNFESRPYPIEAPTSPNDDYNPNWVEKTMRATNARVTIPTGYFAINSGPYRNFPAMLGSWITQPQQFIELSIYETPQTAFFTAANQLKIIQSSSFGLVNKGLGAGGVGGFAGCNPETLLLDSIAYRPYLDWLGQELCDVRVSLIYNDWGWNKQPDPGGVLQPVVYRGLALSGTNSPFATFDMKAFFLGINPFPS